jgi:hypothetical protein
MTTTASPDDSNTPTVTPDLDLARTIVAALKESGILLESRAEKAIEKISQGKASQSDWRLWAEDLCLECPDEQESGNANHTN